ncbi:hypothetical protein B0H10DRAFT_1949975 [Mycena sp. CBHHK59/15]|nr:hypothetical protein B0H10DRAFT_1949975 [Mycena sp. CBHHK59/15]
MVLTLIWLRQGFYRNSLLSRFDVPGWLSRLTRFGEKVHAAESICEREGKPAAVAAPTDLVRGRDALVRLGIVMGQGYVLPAALLRCPRDTPEDTQRRLALGSAPLHFHAACAPSTRGHGTLMFLSRRRTFTSRSQVFESRMRTAGFPALRVGLESASHTYAAVNPVALARLDNRRASEL